MRLDYYRGLRRMLAHLQVLVDERLVPQIDAMAADVRSDARLDRQSSRVEQVIGGIRLAYAERVTEGDMSGLASSVGRQTADFNKGQIDRQFKAVLGIDVFTAEPWLAERLADFARVNAALIKSISDDHLTKVQTIVTEGVASGRPTAELRKEIQALMGITQRRAALIADDQVGKLNGQLTRLRHQARGVSKYTWRTSKNLRVRGRPDGKYPRAKPSHWAREGKVFSYDQPPSDGNPGEPIRCHCWAEPVIEGFEVLLGDPSSTSALGQPDQPIASAGGNLPPGTGGSGVGNVTGGGGQGGGGGIPPLPPGQPPDVPSHIVSVDRSIVEVTVSPFEDDEADYEKLQRWFDPALKAGYNFEFNWWTSSQTLMAQQANGVYLMKVEADDQDEIETLATFSSVLGENDLPELYIGLVEAAPWNQPGHPERRHKNTFAAVLEAAIKESERRGYNGRVSLIALKPAQLGFYGNYGFTVVSATHRVMALSAQKARAHLLRMEALRAQ